MNICKYILFSVFVSLYNDSYSQNTKLDYARERYTEQLNNDNSHNVLHSRSLKRYAWDCYKLCREFFPKDYELRAEYLNELTIDFKSIDQDYTQNPYWPGDAFADSCLLETHLPKEMIFYVVAYCQFKNYHNNKERFANLMSLCKPLGKFASPIMIEIISESNWVDDVINKYSNDILSAYNKNHVPEEYYIPVYNAMIDEVQDNVQKLKYAKIKLQLFEAIIKKDTDYSSSKSRYLKSFKRYRDRNYLNAVRDICNYTPWDNYVEKAAALKLYAEKTLLYHGKDSKEYGDCLEQMSSHYQTWCINCGKSLNTDNQNVWHEFNIYNQQYQDWLEAAGQLGSRAYNNSVGKHVSISGYHKNDKEEAYNYFWNYVGRVKNKFGEESQEYINALKECSTSVIDKKVVDKEVDRVRIAMLEKDDSDEAKRELADLRAKEGTQQDKIEVLKTIKSPSPQQIMQLASDCNQYGDIDGSIKYWQELLDTCLVMSHGNEEEKRLAAVYSQSGIMQLQMTMQNAGYYDRWWNYASNFIRHYNVDDPQFLNFLLMIVSSCKGDNTSMDYFLKKMDFSLVGDAEQGISLLDEMIGKIKSIDKGSDIYAHILATKADMYCYSQEFDKARQLLDEATSIIDKTKGKESLEHLQYAIYKEIVSAYEQKYDDAIQLALEERKIFEKNNNNDCREYYCLLFRLQTYYSKLKNYDKVLEFGEVLNIENVYTKRTIISQLFPFHVQGPYDNISVFYKELSTLALANAYYHKKESGKSHQIISELIDKTKKSITDNYSAFTRAKQKNMMPWVNILNTYTPLYAYRMPQYDWAKQCYDAALLYKHFSLAADNALKRIIQRSDNPRLKEKLKELEQTRQLFDTANEVTIDSLSRRVTQLEAQLLVDVKRYGDVGEEMDASCYKLQQKLTFKDAAIEFTSCLEEDGQCHYMANIISKGMVKNIYLCTDEELKNANDPYTSKTGYNLIWVPLEEDLSGIENIYFSATGRLHQMGIEYFPVNNEGVLMSDKYNVHRLSSTRELITSYPEDKSNKAFLYGGIEYEWDLRKDEDMSHASIKTDVPNVGDNNRAGFSYLPGTKAEVEIISTELKKNNVSVALFEGMKGTEESVKELSSETIKILHIATHGFYNPKGRRTKFDSLFKDKSQYSSLEDVSMTRSGLLMAGAVNSINSKPKSGVDDGVLTSKEISSLDLTHLDMAVLSACETGLGDIGSEGVFGLQRAFKKAGAHTLLMSLRKVDDNATKILMTNFYNNLQTMSKLKAFREAQKQLRAAENGKYNSPEHWASFIMLDD